MVEITSLWLPILASAVAVFVVSFIIHMFLPWHKNEYPALPDQDKVMDALRPFNIPPGDYWMPRPASRETMNSPEFIEKMKRGPVGVLSIWPNGPVSMGKSLFLWFVYSVAVGVFAAYVAGRALTSGASYLEVFRFAGVSAFLGYAGALWQMSIWYKRAWSITVKHTVDGLIYALLTGGFFGWLWPQ